MKAHDGPHGRNGNGTILKSKGQIIREQGALIMKYEQEAKAGVAQIEELKWMCARYRVSINALAAHFKITPEQMKDIIQPYFDGEMEQVKEQMDALKKKFVDDVKAGKTPEFTVLDNPDADVKD